MSALVDLVMRSPLVDVVGMDLRKGVLMADVSGLENLPTSRRLVLLPGKLAQAAVRQMRDEVTLLPDGPERPSVSYHYGLDDIGFSVDMATAEFTVYFQRFPDDRGRYASTWWGGERRRDSLMRKWNRSLPRMVMDDFGTLVSVEGGEA